MEKYCEDCGTKLNGFECPHCDIEEDDFFDEQDYLERREYEKAECTCGAYQFGKNGIIQVADCICGRT